MIAPALDARSPPRPADIAPVVEDVVAKAQAEDTESPEFQEQYGQMIGWVKDNCGFGELNVIASEYKFGGVPPKRPRPVRSSSRSTTRAASSTSSP